MAEWPSSLVKQILYFVLLRCKDMTVSQSRRNITFSRVPPNINKTAPGARPLQKVIRLLDSLVSSSECLLMPSGSGQFQCNSPQIKSSPRQTRRRGAKENMCRAGKRAFEIPAVYSLRLKCERHDQPAASEPPTPCVSPRPSITQAQATSDGHDIDI